MKARQAKVQAQIRKEEQAQALAMKRHEEARLAIVRVSDANAAHAAEHLSALGAQTSEAARVKRETTDIAFRMQEAAARAEAGLGMKTIVLVIAHNRPEYLQRCLAALIQHHPSPGKMLPLLISEDRAPCDPLPFI